MSESRGLVSHNLGKRWGRPAKKQINEGDKIVQHATNADSTEYNIWYSRFQGDRQHKYDKDRPPAEFRCNLDQDAGITKGCDNPDAYLCIHFARGECFKGENCPFLHDIPTLQFEQCIPITRDCFGRERHGTVKDDRGGVGSFNVDDETQRTLFVGGLKDAPDLMDKLYEHFGEWGTVEDIRLFSARGFGFLRYRMRTSAEFAKIAMAEQAVLGGEVLNIRWSNGNPMASRNKRKDKVLDDKLAQIIHERLGGSNPLASALPGQQAPGVDAAEEQQIKRAKHEALTEMQNDHEKMRAKQEGLSYYDDDGVYHYFWEGKHFLFNPETSQYEEHSAETHQKLKTIAASLRTSAPANTTSDTSESNGNASSSIATQAQFTQVEDEEEEEEEEEYVYDAALGQYVPKSEAEAAQAKQQEFDSLAKPSDSLVMAQQMPTV